MCAYKPPVCEVVEAELVVHQDLADQDDPAGQVGAQGLVGQAGRAEILRGSRMESHLGIPGLPNTQPIIAELIQVVHPGQEYRHRGRNIWLDYAEGPAETMDSRVHAFLDRFELFFDMRGAPRELTETATGQTRELIFANGVEVPYFALRVFNEAYCRVLRWEMEARARAAALIAREAEVEARSAKDEGFEEQELPAAGSEDGDIAER